MMTKPCLKAVSFILAFGIVVYLVPITMTGENDHSALSLRIGSSAIYPTEPLMLTFDVDAIPMSASGYAVFVAPDGEAYSLCGDGSFTHGIHPIVTGLGPMDKPVTIDVTAVPPGEIETGLYKVYAAIVRDNVEPSPVEYLGFASSEFSIMEEESVAEEMPVSSGVLTITTYAGGDEGHLITFPDGVTMSIDCADGDITTISHGDGDHCNDDGQQYRWDNVSVGQNLYEKDGVTVKVVAANGSAIDGGSWGCSGGANPCSMALWVRYGGFDYLTAGDMYGPGEGHLGSWFAGQHINVDVLKVSHHGTCTEETSSLSFLNNIKPEYATISGTKTNPCKATKTCASPTTGTIPNLIEAGVKRIYCIPRYTLESPCLDSVPPEVCNGSGTTRIITDGCTYSIVGKKCSVLDIPVDDESPTCFPTETPTVIPTKPPTPTPTVTPLPKATISLRNPNPKTGDKFEAWFKTCEPIDQPFTAFVFVVMPDRRIVNAWTLGLPIVPVAQNVSWLSEQYTELLISRKVPKGAPKGTYELVVALFDAGKPIPFDPEEPMQSLKYAFLVVRAFFTIAE